MTQHSSSGQDLVVHVYTESWVAFLIRALHKQYNPLINLAVYTAHVSAGVSLVLCA